MANRPKILYKYLPDNAGSEAVLRDCTIKFTVPNKFNDPFDCKAVDISYWNRDDWVSFFKIRLGRNLYSENQILEFADNAIKANVSWKDVDDFINDFGVFCLSELNDDILMWSHYADCHKGFCVGFHVGDNNDSFFNEIAHVNYEKIYPKLSSSASSKETAETIMLIKSRHWKYEQEWRKIKDLKGSGEIHPYPEKLLACVIFGAKMDQKPREKLLDIIDQKSVKPEIFEAKLCKRSFSLEINLFNRQLS